MNSTRRRRGKRGQFIVMASLSMAILMISFTTFLVGYSVSPVRFNKSNFREIQMQAVSNFRRALAISLSEVSQQLEFKARVRQYSMYLDLDNYPQAKNLGYDILSSWQNLTMLTYPGVGLNLSTSIPAYSCMWNESSGISRVGANMTLDILSYGFFWFEDASIASLNLTILDLNQSSPTTSFFFSLKAENNRPVPDLSDSSVQIFYQKTNGGWFAPNSSAPYSPKVFYLGQGAYLVRFVANQIAYPPHIRLIVQDSRKIFVGARSILSSSDDTVGPTTSSVVAVPNPSNSATSVTVTASISDLYVGWSNILSAECVVKDSNGLPVFQGNMMAGDGAFNEITEGVVTNLDVSSWSFGNYTVQVRGQDARGNWGDFDTLILRIAPAPKMHVENIDMSSERQGGRVRAMAIVTILDDRGLPVEGATVRAHWSGADTGNVFGSTNTLGTVTLVSNWKNVPKGTHVTFTITIDSVERTTYIYDTTANKEVSDSVTT